MPSLCWIVSKTLEWQCGIWFASLDVRKAFDKVEHGVLFAAVTAQGIPDGYLDLWMMAMYQDQTGTMPGSEKFSTLKGSSAPSFVFASPVATFTARGRRPWHRYGTWPQRFCNGDRLFSTGWCQPLPNSQARAARPSPTLHWCVQGPRPHITRQGGAHAPCVGAGSYSDVVAA